MKKGTDSQLFSGDPPALLFFSSFLPPSAAAATPPVVDLTAQMTPFSRATLALSLSLGEAYPLAFSLLLADGAVVNGGRGSTVFLMTPTVHCVQVCTAFPPMSVRRPTNNDERRRTATFFPCCVLEM